MALRISAGTVVCPFAVIVDSIKFNSYFLLRSNQLTATASPQTIAVYSLGEKLAYALWRSTPLPGVQRDCKPEKATWRNRRAGPANEGLVLLLGEGAALAND